MNLESAHRDPSHPDETLPGALAWPAWKRICLGWLVFTLPSAACSYLGSFAPVPGPGVRVVSRCADNDSVEARKEGVRATASGTWSNSSSYFYVTIQNQRTHAISVNLPAVRAVVQGEQPIPLSYVLVRNQWYPLEAEDFYYRKRIEEQGSEEDYLKSLPVRIPADSSELFEFGFPQANWKELTGKPVALEVRAMTENERMLDFRLPFTVSRKWFRHREGTCPLNLHSGP